MILNIFCGAGEFATADVAESKEPLVNILTVNLLLSTFVFWIAARLYLLPRLHACEPRDVLLPILLLHALRHLGLMFLASGAVYPGIPAQFAVPAALGDLLAAVLAVIAIPAVATRARSAKALVWLFNLEGSLDLAAAIALATLARRGAVHGTRILDSGVLGAGPAGHPLHHVPGSACAVARGDESAVGRLPLASKRSAAAPQRCGALFRATMKMRASLRREPCLARSMIAKPAPAISLSSAAAEKNAT